MPEAQGARHVVVEFQGKSEVLAMGVVEACIKGIFMREVSKDAR